MTTDDNRALMQRIFADLARGDGRAFGEAMAEDFCWTVSGRSAWSQTWRGREKVREKLLKPLFAQFADRYTNTARRIHADGDFVIVECDGRVTTKAGARYDNSYCFVIRMSGGQMKELTEYMDTARAEQFLAAPA